MAPSTRVSNFGALYGIDVVPNGTAHQMKIACSIYFNGGSASSPAVYPDGTRIYIGDNGSNLLALDNDCNQVWSLDVGGNITGAIAVSSDNHELYASTQTDVVQVFDRGDKGEIGWKRI